jgi:pimeloyl-ACP methyl ester carboxylesterase
LRSERLRNTGGAGGNFEFKESAMSVNSGHTEYKTKTVDGVRIFYREAGSAAHPTIVLLHGFPSSSHMFRDLIPLLSPYYHVIAPDMPGYGYSDQPEASQFVYSFDHLAEVMDAFLHAAGVQKYSIYIQDYGAPVGFRLFVKHPESIEAIISQNGNAYQEGFGSFWDEVIVPYWKEKTPETEKKVSALLTPEMTKFQYTEGYSDAGRISPDSYTFDQMTLDRPGNRELQLNLFYDYQNNVKQYPRWQEALRTYRPPVLAVWGRNDPIFVPAGAEAFRRDVPEAEIHLIDSGHFALEDNAEQIAGYIRDFLKSNLR